MLSPFIKNQSEECIARPGRVKTRISFRRTLKNRKNREKQAQNDQKMLKNAKKSQKMAQKRFIRKVAP